ncbi:hypothetical protein MSAN_00961900 [Mycena sanguinolenta]|uniref:Uncharacterized protein n=1 Tax=Mycena sanguinolenta TaxID=230812 RepID=A0A8H6YY06_9AGAR|nr:hypothetical protein MSAN_00961900 [Mycena sanguinolenta]
MVSLMFLGIDEGAPHGGAHDAVLGGGEHLVGGGHPTSFYLDFFRGLSFVPYALLLSIVLLWLSQSCFRSSFRTKIPRKPAPGPQRARLSSIQLSHEIGVDIALITPLRNQCLLARPSVVPSALIPCSGVAASASPSAFAVTSLSASVRVVRRLVLFCRDCLRIAVSVRRHQSLRVLTRHPPPRSHELVALRDRLCIAVRMHRR